MAQVLGETFEVFGSSKRDHRDSSVRRRDLLVELPQLREMLLAVESTEVAQQNQHGWAPKKSVGVEDRAINGEQIKVEIRARHLMARSLSRARAKRRSFWEEVGPEKRPLRIDCM